MLTARKSYLSHIMYSNVLYKIQSCVFYILKTVAAYGNVNCYFYETRTISRMPGAARRADGQEKSQLKSVESK